MKDDLKITGYCCHACGVIHFKLEYFVSASKVIELADRKGRKWSLIGGNCGNCSSTALKEAFHKGMKAGNRKKAQATFKRISPKVLDALGDQHGGR